MWFHSTYKSNFSWEPMWYHLITYQDFKCNFIWQPEVQIRKETESGLGMWKELSTDSMPCLNSSNSAEWRRPTERVTRQTTRWVLESSSLTRGWRRFPSHGSIQILGRGTFLKSHSDYMLLPSKKLILLLFTSFSTLLFNSARRDGCFSKNLSR